MLFGLVDDGWTAQQKKTLATVVRHDLNID
jgi:hypothetical protein